MSMHSHHNAEELHTKAGAERLAERIRDYWAARGHCVALRVVEAGFQNVMRGVRHDVRSDMVNGLPRPKGQGRRMS